MPKTILFRPLSGDSEHSLPARQWSLPWTGKVLSEDLGIASFNIEWKTHIIPPGLKSLCPRLIQRGLKIFTFVFHILKFSSYFILKLSNKEKGQTNLCQCFKLILSERSIMYHWLSWMIWKSCAKPLRPFSNHRAWVSKYCWYSRRSVSIEISTSLQRIGMFPEQSQADKQLPK